jgi:hypothetical protein
VISRRAAPATIILNAARKCPIRFQALSTPPGSIPRIRALRLDKEQTMAKGQKKTNRETRKPKAEKPKPQNASNPSTKPGGLSIVTLKS